MSNRCGVARATATAWMTVVGAFVSTLVTTGAAQASLIWDGNASKGTGVFGNLNCDSPSTLTAVSDPAGVHGTVWRYHKPATETRCENHGIAVNGTRYEFSNGSTYYFGWWSRLTNTSDNNANFQWKSYGSWCCQNFPVWLGHMRGGSSTFFYHKPAPSCSNGGCITEWSMPISPNVWNHYVLRLHLSDVDGQGTMQLWFNGVQQTFDTGSQTLAGRTWDAPGFNEPKWGVYGGSGVDMTNYVAGMKVGTAFADVAPAGSTPTPTPTPTPSPTATPTATPTTPRPTPTPTATATSTTPPTDVEVTPAAGSVTASTNDGNLPGNVVDNNLGTRWSAIGDPQWIKLDLGSARIVTRARIAVFNGNTRQNRFDLQVSTDNTNWTGALTGASSSGTTTQEEDYDLGGRSARYVRYLGHGSTDPTKLTTNSLTEISVFAVATTPTATPTSAPTYVDVTPGGAAVTASTNDGNVPANTVDNDLRTRWSANGDGQWLQLDLGSVRRVGYVNVAVYNGNTRSNIFELQLSTGDGNWTTVFNGQSNGTTTAEQKLDFNDTDARLVRYLGHMNTANTFNSVTEVSVFAVP